MKEDTQNIHCHLLVYLTTVYYNPKDEGRIPYTIPGPVPLLLGDVQVITTIPKETISMETL